MMNLGDNIWIHSNNYDDIVDIIANGKPEKGKIGQKHILSPDQISMIANYIIHFGESKE